MKGGLEVIIRADCLSICYGRTKVLEDVQGEDLNAGACLQEFTDKHGISSTSVNLFVAEDLLYVTSLELPVRTPDIGDAVRFQLGMVTPFQDDDVLYKYITRREGDVYRVDICATRLKPVLDYVDELVGSGFQVRGLYPESQRYVSANMAKLKWAQVFPGKLTKVLTFSGSSFENCLLCDSVPDLDTLSELIETESIYHVSPPPGSRFLKIDSLLEGRPILKEFNMLPESYRRPDYLRIALIALLVVNIVSLVFVAGGKLKSLDRMIERTDGEIRKIMPLVKEVADVRGKIKQSQIFLQSIQALEANSDLVDFMARLTGELPEASYLDQLRLDGRENVIVIQGYTDDVGELTDKLQGLGEIRLKSTSRRKNRTYFQVEIGLP